MISMNGYGGWRDCICSKVWNHVVIDDITLLGGHVFTSWNQIVSKKVNISWWCALPNHHPTRWNFSWKGVEVCWTRKIPTASFVSHDKQLRRTFWITPVISKRQVRLFSREAVPGRILRCLSQISIDKNRMECVKYYVLCCVFVYLLLVFLVLIYRVVVLVTWKELRLRRCVRLLSAAFNACQIAGAKETISHAL